MEVKTSDKVKDGLGQEGIDEFVESFLRHKPIEDIEFVPAEWVLNKSFPKNEAPMYTVGNDDGQTMLVWPVSYNGERYFFLEYLEERPDMVSELRLN